MREIYLKQLHDTRSIQRALWWWCVRPHFVVVLSCWPILAWWTLFSESEAE